MSEYYGVSTPTESYLAHYGVRGMKWGVRKAVQVTGNGRPHSKAYSDAEKKLKRATMAGGLIGGTISAIRNREALRQNSSKTTSIRRKPIQKNYRNVDQAKVNRYVNKINAYAKTPQGQQKLKQYKKRSRRNAMIGGVLSNI